MFKRTADSVVLESVLAQPQHIHHVRILVRDGAPAVVEYKAEAIYFLTSMHSPFEVAGVMPGSTSSPHLIAEDSRGQLAERICL